MKQPKWMGKQPTVLPVAEIELPDGTKRFKYPARAPLVTADGKGLFILKPVSHPKGDVTCSKYGGRM